MRSSQPRRASPGEVVAVIAACLPACSLVYGIGDNLGPREAGVDAATSDAPADVRLDLSPGVDAPSGADSPVDAGAPTWCTTNKGDAAFCEDFDRGSLDAGGWSSTTSGDAQVGLSTLDPASAPNELRSVAGAPGAAYVSRLFPITSSTPTTRLTLAIDFEQPSGPGGSGSAASIPHLIDLTFSPNTDGSPPQYTFIFDSVNNTPYLSAWNDATSSGEGVAKVSGALNPGNVQLSLTVAWGVMATVSIAGVGSATLPYGGPYTPSWPWTPQSVVLHLGVDILPSTGTQTIVHYDDVLFDPQ